MNDRTRGIMEAIILASSGHPSCAWERETTVWVTIGDFEVVLRRDRWAPDACCLQSVRFRGDPIEPDEVEREALISAALLVTGQEWTR